MKRLILVLGLLGSPVGAQVVWMDGNRLLELCQSRNSIEQANCYAYIAGVLDGTRFADELLDEISDSVGPNLAFTPPCLSANVKSNQLGDIMVKYYLEKPERRHFQAAGEVYVHIFKTFPCE